LARASRWLSGTSYLQKWLVLGVLIGTMAGVGAIVFYEALEAATHLFLGVLAGYHVPTPAGEGGTTASAWFARPWALPLIVGFGALLGAIIVYRFAPDAEGHGTDAAISAVHHNPRGIRVRTIIVKIVASALTIGAGGSGGREGPTGQISAGFGSLLARELDLSPADARTAVTAGIGSGIGAIFGAPLGGAVLATEILYRDDFDGAALLPSFIASIVGYVIFASVVGFTPLFGFNGSYHFTDPTHLLWFALIGVLGGFIGLLYAKGFYGIASLFERIRLPRWTRPAIGGVLVGCIGLVIPEVLGTGYGWIQAGLGHRLLTLPLWIVLVVPFARIVATGLSIGSGGSGGIFGPGMVIGAFIGASVWRVFEPVVPSMGHNPAPYVIVGMMCCFGGISRAPLAVMLMVAEMTGSLSILAPAMIAVGLSWFIVRRSDDTIYRSQLKNRSDAPAQRMLTGMPVLAQVAVQQAMAPIRLVLSGRTPRGRAGHEIDRAHVPGAPVVDVAGRYIGTVALSDIADAGDDTETVESLADRSAPTVSSAATLDTALEALVTAAQRWVPVLDDERRVVGTISTSDVVRGYRLGLLASLRRLDGSADAIRTDDIEVAVGSQLADRPIGGLGLPPSIVVTTIERDRDLVIPNGTTVLEPGDRLALIGSPGDIERLRAEASGTPGDVSVQPQTDG
jgi:H+/Cl- antiporter ClcA/CBS domain-containing protein